jgi:hypothetical protein
MLVVVPDVGSDQFNGLVQRWEFFGYAGLRQGERMCKRFEMSSPVTYVKVRSEKKRQCLA